MNRRIVLDTGVLGILTHPRRSVLSDDCRAWLVALAANGDSAHIPEAADYELRREYLRRQSTNAIQKLDDLVRQAIYTPLETAHWRRAAILWATSRQGGFVTAPPDDLDIDVLIASQAQALAVPGFDVIIATTNVRHFAPFADARRWEDI